MIFDALVYGIALPVVVAIVTLVALGRPRRGEEPPAGTYAAGTALGLAYLGGHWALDGPLELVPRDVVDWMPHLAVLGLAWSIAAHRVGDRPGLRSGLDVVVGLLAAYLLVRPVLSRMQPWEVGVALGLGAAALAALARLVEHASEDGHPTASSALLTIYAAAAAGVTAASGTIRIGQLLGVVAAGLGAITVATPLFRHPVRITPMARVAVMLLWGGIVLAELYAELRPVPLSLLTFCPIAVVGASVALRRRSAALRFVFELGLVLVLVGTAGWRAVAGGLAEPDSGGGTDYGYAYE